jgi:subtilase family serine protease
MGPVDESRLTPLTGNVHPMGRGAVDQGAVETSLPMERMVLVLKRSAEQDAALASFMAGQYDPQSVNFHHWLTPEEFGAAYGPSDSDIQAVTGWLQNHGFRVDNVSKGKVTIEFSGTAGMVAEALHTEIHRYAVNGVSHIANVSDPQIPEALAPVVIGVASLHDFFPKSQMVKGGLVTRDPASGRIKRVKAAGNTLPGGSAGRGATAQYVYTDENGISQEDVTPYDFATIYNLLPLWNAGITGTGQTIAISGVSDINLADVATFQSSFGLPSNVPTIVHNGTDPGYDPNGGQAENTLDVEWSGATAPGAKVVLVISAGTNTTGAPQLSAMYIVDNRVGNVMSASYGECEAGLGAAGNAVYNLIYQQGAAEGISMFESAGDQGSAGCDDSDANTPNAAEYGLQVNGLASSPYITAVGGTDFTWQGSQSTYWNTTNSSTNLSSAKGYIPETIWNFGCSSPEYQTFFGVAGAEIVCNDVLNITADQFLVNIVAGSGGVSACTNITGSTLSTCSGGYPKPAWQTGTGVPADGKRDLPDVSLFASSGFPDPIQGSAYLFCQSTATIPCNYASPSQIVYQEVGGTSVSSPAMAGIMALVLQKVGSAQGLANPVFYALAARQNTSGCNSSTAGNGSSCVFYDVTAGTNAPVCLTGSLNCVTSRTGDQVGILSGYSSTTGYDLTSGLGSVNATNLANAWASVANAELTSTTGLVLSATSVSPTTSVTFTATVTGKSGSPTPTGTVNFYNGTTALGAGTLNGSGVATLTTTEPVGTYSVVADYSGDSVYFGSVSTAQTLVSASNLVPTTTGLTIAPSATLTYGQSSTLTAVVTQSTGIAAGTVTFNNGYTVLGSTTLNGSGIATLPVVLSAGSGSLTAVYGGSTTSATSTSVAVPVSVAFEPVVVTAANATKVAGQANPTLTGTIVGAVNGDVLTATYSTTATTSSPAGTYPISVVSVAGSNIMNYVTTFVSGTLTVTAPAPTATTTGLTASASSVVSGTNVTFTATVAVTPGTAAATGTVTFKDGGTTIGTGTVGTGGVATYATTALAVGSHSVTASYVGDTFNAASVSSAVAVTVTDFTISLSPTTATVSGGTSAATTVSITPVNAFNAATTMSCSGLPVSAVCTFGSGTVTPNGTAVATSSLSISTVAADAKLDAPKLRGWGMGATGAVLALLLWPGVTGRRRRAAWLRMVCLVLLAGLAAAGLSGCGNKSTAATQPASATYTVTVTGTAGSTAHSTSFTLTVD